MNILEERNERATAVGKLAEVLKERSKLDVIFTVGECAALLAHIRQLEGFRDGVYAATKENK